MNFINDFIKINNISIEHFIRKDKKNRIVKECPICNIKFETARNSKEKTTCSISCSNTFFRSGVNHGNFKDINDYDERTKHFSKKYRKICFEYHQHKCVICDESKILDVHHFDGNKFNNIPENLIPLCPTHHNYLHSKYKDEVIEKVKDYIKQLDKSNFGMCS